MAPAEILLPRGRRLSLARGPLIMGILNITPDSFSDGGRFLQREQALEHAGRMEAEGADLIDIGGESSRPGAGAITLEEEWQRVEPVLSALRKRSGLPVSIDTAKPELARRALAAGADLINHVSNGSQDREICALAAKRGVPLVLMHMQGQPRTMQANPRYADVVREVREHLTARAERARAQGVKQVLMDPGIGFGKTLEHNLALLKALPEFVALGYPVLLGASRKSFLGEILSLRTEARLEGSLAVAVWAALSGVSILRVHDVKEHRRALAMAVALK